MAGDGCNVFMFGWIIFLKKNPRWCHKENMQRHLWRFPMTKSPNIIFITVDELRFPMNFPKGVSSADEFMQRFMPNTYDYLWNKGVKFYNHQIAACDCTPSRGAFVTGLYSHQTYMLLTRANKTGTDLPAPQPSLNTGFPTYGKLLRQRGYLTPYIGKWHLSDAPLELNAPLDYLDVYGFEGLTTPDPIGMPGEGLGGRPPAVAHGSVIPNDAYIAAQAIAWIEQKARNVKADGEETPPFCMSVGFVNPHDKQFFWGGIEWQRYADMFQQAGQTPMTAWHTTVLEQCFPPELGYGMPDNWESSAQLAEKPQLQTYFQSFTNCWVGGISDTPGDQSYHLEPSKLQDRYQAIAPYEYWLKCQDMYTQAIREVDRQIGQFLCNIPEDVAKETVFVFMSDHGEYAGSHGLQGKGAAVYRESVQVPLIVADYTGQFANSIDIPRQQLTSTVDVLPLFLSLAEGGNDWKSDPWLNDLYGNRADLYNILRDPDAPGRKFAVTATDESFPLNGAPVPEHVLGAIGPEGKLGAYSVWKDDTMHIIPESTEFEYYNYTTRGGLLELDSTPDTAAADAMKELLFSDLVPNELQKPLPTDLLSAQQEAEKAYWDYIKRSRRELVLPTIFNG
jgi:uncharacterized sulfatase